MADFNQFIISGFLVKAPLSRMTSTGVCQTTYVVVVDRSFADADGKMHSGFDYIPVVTYARQAENDAKYLKKGSLVEVTGRIHSWFQPADKRGGFNFEALRVTYISKAKATQKEAAVIDVKENLSEHDEWVANYESAMQLEEELKPTPPRHGK